MRGWVYNLAMTSKTPKPASAATCEKNARQVLTLYFLAANEHINNEAETKQVTEMDGIKFNTRANFLSDAPQKSKPRATFDTGTVQMISKFHDRLLELFKGCNSIEALTDLAEAEVQQDVFKLLKFTTVLPSGVVTDTADPQGWYRARLMQHATEAQMSLVEPINAIWTRFLKAVAFYAASLNFWLGFASFNHKHLCAYLLTMGFDQSTVECMASVIRPKVKKVKADAPSESAEVAAEVAAETAESTAAAATDAAQQALTSADDISALLTQ